jgi:hypothetical protein
MMTLYLCTFEALILAYGRQGPELGALAPTRHGIIIGSQESESDRDRRGNRPQGP